MAKKLYIGVEALPAGYTPVEYIEGNGTQYIDTDVSMLDGIIGVDIDFQFTKYVDNTFIYRQYCNGDLLGIGLYNNAFYTINVTMSQTSNMLARTTASGTASGTANMKVLLFAQSVSNGTTTTITNCCYGRIYSCQIYKDGIKIRDYLPVINNDGTAGLFDLITSNFYTNNGTGSFTSGSATNKTFGSIARNVKSIFLGVNNKASKIKKAYIGIGNIARPWWSGAELAYYGTITDLTVGRHKPSAASVGNYALFAGGNTNSSSTTFAVDSVDAYNKSLVKSTAPNMSIRRYTMAAVTIGEYALFAGGDAYSGTSTIVKTVDAYSSTLTKLTAPDLEIGVSDIDKSAASLGDYALIAGGFPQDSDTYGVRTDIVNAYNKSLTKTLADRLSSARREIRANVVGNYILFAGGTPSMQGTDVIDVYNTSLTRTTSAILSSPRLGTVNVSTGNYAIFAGGYTTGLAGGFVTMSCEVEAFNASLTRTMLSSLISEGDGVRDAAGTVLDGFALICGGLMTKTWNDYTARSIIDVYDSGLVKNPSITLPTGVYALDATTIGNYALFAGGKVSGEDYTASAIVNAITI